MCRVPSSGSSLLLGAIMAACMGGVYSGDYRPDESIGRWQLHDLNDPECSDCGHIDRNFLCSQDFGVVPINMQSLYNSSSKCIRYVLPDKILNAKITKEKMNEALGANAVIAFVGDSQARYMFLETMNFFGYEDWYEDLYRAAETTWDYKRTHGSIQRVLTHTSK